MWAQSSQSPRLLFVILDLHPLESVDEMFATATAALLKSVTATDHKRRPLCPNGDGDELSIYGGEEIIINLLNKCLFADMAPIAWQHDHFLPIEINDLRVGHGLPLWMVGMW